MPTQLFETLAIVANTELILFVRTPSVDSDEPRTWTTKDFCDVLANKKGTLSFFNYLEKKFNGDLFKFDDSQAINQNALNVIIDVLNGITLKTGQMSLFDVFDFSIIPVEFISLSFQPAKGSSIFQVGKIELPCQSKSPVCASSLCSIYLLWPVRVLFNTCPESTAGHDYFNRGRPSFGP